MAEYLYFEVDAVQSPKKPDAPCGDYWLAERLAQGTLFVLADGIGSGSRARIAAILCATRLRELWRQGLSPRQAAASVAGNHEQWRDVHKPYAAFNLARLRPDGAATILAYEAPPPLLIDAGQCLELPARPVQLGHVLLNEYECRLGPGSALFFMSDGITQAGLGSGLPLGWQSAGVRRLTEEELAQGRELAELPGRVHAQAVRLWKKGGDDCTAALLHCRPGQVANILTGPPADPELDEGVVQRFMARPGLKIVCGATTASLVARETGAHLSVKAASGDLVAPPRYLLPGLDLVTEGAVTLNQAFHIFGEDLGQCRSPNPVIELCMLLNVCDRVNFLVGEAFNDGNTGLVFKQQGILDRRHIVPKLAEKLRAAGKLVVIEQA